MIGPTAPSTATPAIAAVWEAVAERWGDRVTSWGVSCCRRIGASACSPTLPGGDWSQHAWGNGWDIHASAALLDRIALFLRSDAMRRHVAQVLWRVPDHYDHIHVSGRPMQTGTPPCAGGVDGVVGGAVEAPEPLPTMGELVVSESWAVPARAATREFLQEASRVASWGRMLHSIMRAR